MQRLLNHLLAWIGKPPRNHAFMPEDGAGSDPMSAMPRANQMDEVLRNLVAKPDRTALASAATQAHWRVVSRDGSTSSVSDENSDDGTRKCPGCAAGRCGENPEMRACAQCKNQTISLDQLTGSQALAATVDEKALNAAMPQASPQLFEKTSSANLLKSAESQTAAFLVALPVVPVNAASSLEATESPAVEPLTEDDADLKRVVSHWPLLSAKTRQAILTLVDLSGEADSA